MSALPFQIKTLVEYKLPLFHEFSSPDLGNRAFLYTAEHISENTVLNCFRYEAYHKVERSFFQAYLLVPKGHTGEEEPTAFLFTTPYPVKNLYTSLLGYRSAAAEDVDDLLPSSKLLLRNKSILVFGMDNGCVLIASQKEHPQLGNALSSNM